MRHHDRGARRGGRAASAAEGVRQARGAPVRVLHARHDHGREGAHRPRPGPFGRRREGGAQREPVPVRRVPADSQGGHRLEGVRLAAARHPPARRRRARPGARSRRGGPRGDALRRARQGVRPGQVHRRPAASRDDPREAVDQPDRARPHPAHRREPGPRAAGRARRDHRGGRPGGVVRREPRALRRTDPREGSGPPRGRRGGGGGRRGRGDGRARARADRGRVRGTARRVRSRRRARAGRAGDPPREPALRRQPQLARRVALRRRRGRLRGRRPRQAGAVRREPDLPEPARAARRRRAVGAPRRPPDALDRDADAALRPPHAVAGARRADGLDPRDQARRRGRVRLQGRDDGARLLRRDPRAADRPPGDDGVLAGGDGPALPRPPQAVHGPEGRREGRRDHHRGGVPLGPRRRGLHVLRRDHRLLRRLHAADALPDPALQVRRRAGVHEPAGLRGVPRPRRAAAAFRLRVDAGHAGRGSRISTRSRSAPATR